MELNQIVRSSYTFPTFFGSKNEDVTGNHIYESKEVFNSFDIKLGLDLRYCYTVGRTSHSMDLSFTQSQEFCLEAMTCPNTNEVLFSHLVQDSANVMYSEFCTGSNNLFACAALNKAEFAIFNIAYSQSDYLKLREKILNHMVETRELGEFFPSSLSPFAYNHSIAHEYQPLDQREVLKRGLVWEEDRTAKASKINPPPRLYSEITQSTSSEIFSSKASNKNFKLIPQELEFYKKTSIPPPDLTFDERHIQRMELRGARDTFKRKCSGCGIQVTSAFDEAYAPKVACDECYLKELDVLR